MFQSFSARFISVPGRVEQTLKLERAILKIHQKITLYRLCKTVIKMLKCYPCIVTST